MQGEEQKALAMSTFPVINALPLNTSKSNGKANGKPQQKKRKQDYGGLRPSE